MEHGCSRWPCSSCGITVGRLPGQLFLIILRDVDLCTPCIRERADDSRVDYPPALSFSGTGGSRTRSCVECGVLSSIQIMNVNKPTLEMTSKEKARTSSPKVSLRPSYCGGERTSCSELSKPRTHAPVPLEGSPTSASCGPSIVVPR